jgi:hypothetical protein
MNSYQPQIHSIFCGELCTENHPDNNMAINLSYYKINNMQPNVKIQFAKFIKDVTGLSPRIIDLLEIASYVHAADRKVSRGKRDSVNNDAWSRIFELHIPVSDHDFWHAENTKSLLSSALVYMTGDRRYEFHFEKYKRDPILTEHQSLLFSGEYSTVEEAVNTDIIGSSGFKVYGFPYPTHPSGIEYQF